MASPLDHGLGVVAKEEEIDHSSEDDTDSHADENEAGLRKREGVVLYENDWQRFEY